MNKRTNFVTWIQVYEYYISHHSGKTFESVFGGVTCLPGCFCMYRLKAPGKEPGSWIPVLTNPEIIEEYSQGTVETLHEKNLLLLGEDRFLTTLMIRNFPRRKMMFVPKALCKTVVPDEFKVLLSQRRRWINSTVHNLMELLLVRNLCGTFCFSMQFVILMELIGTVSLPVAIFMTYYLIGHQIYNIVKHKGSQPFENFIPLLLLFIILFLPAILILVTTRKLIYILWMFIYLAGLFIWNFVLPVYAYWNFDDFSWGDTRKVEGGSGKDDHGSAEGTFDPSKIPLKRWEDYELAWRRHLRKLQNRDTYMLEKEKAADAITSESYPSNSESTIADHHEDAAEYVHEQEHEAVQEGAYRRFETPSIPRNLHRFDGKENRDPLLSTMRSDDTAYTLPDEDWARAEHQRRLREKKLPIPPKD
jgi:chitin synthase